MAVEDALRRADLLADLGRHEDADRLLVQVLAEDPHNEVGLALFGRGLVARKRFGAAEAAVRQLLRAHPDSLRGLLLMARIKCLLRRHRDGVPFARRAVELYPDNVTCLIVLADVLRQVTHGSAEALALAERAIAMEPDYAPAHLQAGEIHLDLGQYAKAERRTLQALKIEPTDPRAMLQLGLARAGLGRFDESRDEVMAALRLNSLPGNINQVIAHVESRAVPSHLAEVYRMALAARGLPDVSYPGAPGEELELVAAQGRLAYRMYSTHAGRAGLRRAGELAADVLTVDPANQDARYVRSRQLSDAGHYVQALSIAEQLLAEGYPHAHLAVVPAQVGLGDDAAALAIIRRALADNPDSPMLLRGEALCLRQLKRYDEALRSAMRAAELSPSAPEVQLQLGLSARCAGDLALAERALRAAVADASDEGYPIAELALLLAETDRWPEAESLMALLSTDLPDASRLVKPCMGLAVAIAKRAVPLMREMGAGEPGAELFDETAHWLGLLLNMYTLTAVGRPAPTASLYGHLTGALAALHNLSALPDSSFALVVRGFDALLDRWRPT